MRIWSVSYAGASFLLSQERLMKSALRYGVDELRPWNRETLERTILYKTHRAILDLPRGVGYWLWKPFIIKETLKEMDAGDVVIYLDAGVEIIGDLSPLVNLCLQKKGLLFFAGHYDDVGAPGPNICSKWTKRDCFVFMDCDEPRYYKGQMLDASCLLLEKTERSVAFIREWFLYCTQSQLLTDQPNICGLPNLNGFIEHRHDQSILSLMANRDGIEFFRHPSQYGNHLKDEPYREPGEWKRWPYGVKGIYSNSPYGTILRHHRGNLGQQNLQVHVRRTISSSQQKVYNAWTQPKELKKWFGSAGYLIESAQIDLHVGGEYSFTIREHPEGMAMTLVGEYFEVHPPSRLVYSWPWKTRVTVEFHNREDFTELVLLHESFPSEKLRDQHATGWDASLDRLVEALSTP